MKSAIALVNFLFCVPLVISEEKPNIVVILVDDLGFGVVSCYNSEAKGLTTNTSKVIVSLLR